MTAPRSGERRLALDGTRAVAVYLVVAFHAGLVRFRGGFIGVDVFFVLSGYLVTQVLLRDLEATSSIRLGRFYSRRVRRLLPASLVALTITAAFYAAVAGPVQVAASVGAFKASFLYVANWYFISQATDYFAGDTGQSPVLHIWSLAVEEQFYLLWPVLFGGLAWATSRMTRHRQVVWRVVIGTAAVASVAWALSLRAAQPERAYFGTDTRAYQLLAGALLALAPMVIKRVARIRWLGLVGAPAGLLAILVLSIRLQRLDPIERGIATTLATCALIVALESDAGGPMQWLLSTRPLVYLGQISYGTYLWHWPVIIVIGEVVEVSPRPLLVVTVLVATGMASLSYHLIEVPIRASSRLDHISWPLVGIGVALSLVAALVMVPRLTEGSGGQEVVVAEGSTERFAPIPDSVDPVAVHSDGIGDEVVCLDEPAQNCTVVEGEGPHILLMGDSNAQAWVPAFTEVAEAEGLTLSAVAIAGCPWQRGFHRVVKEFKDRCVPTKTDAYDRLISELDPDLIVVANSREPTGPMHEEYTDQLANQVLRRTTPGALEELSAGGRSVVILESLPLPREEGFDPRECLEDASVVEECRFLADPTVEWYTRFQRELAASSPNVQTMDLDRLVCPFLPICDPVIGGKVVFWNERHLTQQYSRSLGPDLAKLLKEQGLIPPD